MKIDGIGFVVMLIAASGMDAQDIRGNVVLLVIGIVLMLIGYRQGQSQA